MNLNSPYFDPVRIAPGERRPAAPRRCEEPSCIHAGTHRAPADREGVAWRWFCLDHVRVYNQAYDYFVGMDAGEIAAFIRASATGFSPTRAMGSRGWRHDMPLADRLGIFGESGGVHERFMPPRRVGGAQRRALAVLGLDEEAAVDDIKARYKELVKRHHPDANSGNGGHSGASDETLIRVIQAYDVLMASFMARQERQS